MLFEFLIPNHFFMYGETFTFEKEIKTELSI